MEATNTTTKEQRTEGGSPERGDRKNFGPRRSSRPRRGMRERFKPEFDQKILDIRRVTRVMAGGRRFSFSVTLTCGDHKGRVGVGLGKGSDTAVAIEKAFNNAKKNMIKLSLTKTMSIPHQVEAKFNSSRLIIMPAPGKGLVAGSSVRSVLDLAGVRDVSAKILSRSKNPLNNARAAIIALSKLKAVKETENKESEKKVNTK